MKELELLVKENKSILKMLMLHGNKRTQLPVVERIKEIEQKLIELNENI